METINIEKDGISLSSRGSDPVISRICDNIDNYDLSVKVDVFDSEDNKYVAEFNLPYLQVLMNSDLEEYRDFIRAKNVPSKLLNQENLYDVI